MKTRLDRFKVYNFRSIEESDWIEVSDNSCLVGTNEAGKTNLLIALWKLNPANNEPIVPLDDFPRHLYSNYKADNHKDDVFIAADFILDDELQSEISKELKCDKEQIKRVLVKRKYDGLYYISFPYSKVDSYPVESLNTTISNFEAKLYKEDSFTKEDAKLQKTIKDFVAQISTPVTDAFFSKQEAETIISNIKVFCENNFGKKKNLPEFFNLHLIILIKKMVDAFDGKPIETTKEIRQKVLKKIPKFVYYSDYGNLDSEIYLPRVIEDFKRDDLGEAARAKARTLDVLFKYVKLSPEEIYELGNDRKIVIKKLDYNNREISSVEQNLTEDEVKEWSDKKEKEVFCLILRHPN